MRGAEWLATQLTLLTAVFSLVLTALVSPLVVADFRRRVARSMLAAAGDAAEAVEPRVPAAPPSGASDPGPPVIAVDARGPLALPEARLGLQTAAERRLRRLALAYALGGTVHALLGTLFFFWSFRITQPAPALAVPIFLVFAFPIVPTVAYVMAPRPGARLAWMIAGLALVLVLAGAGWRLVILASAMHLLVPALVFLLFNLRYWRAVAPLLLVLTAAGSLAWLLGVQLGRLALAADSPALWLFRVLGFACGIALAFPVLRLLGRTYRAKVVSDQELFLDSWWAVLTLIQTAVFVVRTGDPAMLVTLGAFPAYWLAKRLGLRLLVRGERGPGLPLLLLRVFGHDRRTETLLDRLTQRWRGMGPIHLIAGPDLALRNLDPEDFHAFVSGRLSRSFVRGAADLRARLAALDLSPDPDGRYRLNQLYCHSDTWKAALDALVLRSAAVLMDLRGFDATREGCRHELIRLGAHLGQMPIVLLADARTDRALVSALLAQGRDAAAAAGRADRRRGGYLLEAGRTSALVIRVATRLLIGATPLA